MINILIVDDKAENLHLLQYLLDSNGYNTITAKNGAEALELMRNNIPDLIISDILMPVMDGFTLCRECKKDKILKNIPFFFYTATYTDSKDEEFALNLGADRFILKPQEPDEFLKIVNDFLKDVSKKKIIPKKEVHKPDTKVLKEYNEILIRKLESKMLQAEKAEKELKIYAEELEKEILERKKKEESLLESQHLFQTLANVSPVGIFRTDSDGNTTYVNPKWIELSGLSSEEAFGNGWLNAIHPEDRGKLSESWVKHLKSKNESNAEYRFLRPDSSVVWVIGKAVPEIFGNEVVGYIGTIIDITERKATEEALVESETKYRQLVTRSPDGIFIIDLQGKFLSANKSICESLHYTEEELLSKKLLEIVPEQYHSLHKQRLTSVLKGVSTNAEAEYEVVGKDGMGHFVEVISVPYYKGKEIVGFQGIARDITDRRQAEKILKESEEKYHRIFENVQDLYYESSMEGKILEVSPSITGLSHNQYVREDLIGKSMFEFYSDSEDRLLLLSALKEKGRVNDFEVVLKNKDGSSIPCSISAKISFDNQGNPEKIIGSMRDISDRKRAELDLIQARDKAEESDRLKTAFLHNISHEVRTPMNAIIGFSNLIANPDLTPEIRNEFIHIVIQSSNQLLSIITQIVNMATIEAGQASVFENEISLNSIFRMLFSQFHSEADRKNISLKYHTVLPDDDDKIRTDDTKLIQIFSNLLSNALKFTKQGDIDFGYFLKDNYLEFYVEDTGIGIQEEMHEEIFKRFRQLETNLARKYEGAGLGLSLSKAYVELLGGKIRLTSKVGEGSIFYFTIPFHKVIQDKIHVKGVASKIELGPEHTITLLVAEDESINVLLLDKYLSKANIEVIHALNGVEAVEICRSSKNIDLVLMDLKMPVMNGFDAVRKIREFLPDLPIIAQTAYSSESDQEKAIACGCNDFISKPFGAEELFALIRKHMDF